MPNKNFNEKYSHPFLFYLKLCKKDMATETKHATTFPYTKG